MPGQETDEDSLTWALQGKATPAVDGVLLGSPTRRARAAVQVDEDQSLHLGNFDSPTNGVRNEVGSLAEFMTMMHERDAAVAQSRKTSLGCIDGETDTR